jgi:formylglycine-generating enzyme required for sulfatase activity
MARYPVTQGQYTEVMGENPSYFQESAEDGESPEARPVEGVSWFDAVRFCNRLSETEGRTPSYRIHRPVEGTAAQPVVEWDRTADGYRLPTEAEWEYACRAETETAYSFGDDVTQLGDHAWFYENSERRTHAVGGKKPNGWGLYDFHGNVWEWCWDWYEDEKVTADKRVTFADPVGPPSGSWRILRGGAFSKGPRNLRSADRARDPPDGRGRDVGFRCARGSVRQP